LDLSPRGFLVRNTFERLDLTGDDRGIEICNTECRCRVGAAILAETVSIVYRFVSFLNVPMSASASRCLTVNQKLCFGRYLEEALLQLDQSNPVTREHVAAVLRQLCAKITAYLQSSGPTDRLHRPMAKLLSVCEIYLRACVR